MNVSPPNWRGVTVIACLYLAVLSACDVLGYKSPSQIRADANAESNSNNTRVINTASKNHLTNQQYAATSGSMKSGGHSAHNAANGDARRNDCGRYMSGQTYYLQSPDGKQKVTQVKVNASGYGAPPKSYYPEAQRRLMTIRASKVDAYRALVEVVGGLHIWGGSAIGDMVIEHDRYRTFIDTYVRGAHVVTVTPMKDGTYRTDVEMDVDQDFLSRVMSFTDPSVDPQCLDRFVSKNSSSDYDGANSTTSSAASNFYYSQ